MNRYTGGWLNIKVLLGAAFFALCIFGTFVALLWSAKPEAYSKVPSTAILSVIQASTATLIPASTPTPRTTSTSAPGAPTPGGPIAIGDFVQVSGTGGEGLRLHGSAGVSSEVRYVALESEVFKIKDGPVEADGYTWWQLQDPYNDVIAGWGAANYLIVVNNPD